MKKLLVIGLLLGSQLSFASGNPSEMRPMGIGASNSQARAFVGSDADERCLKYCLWAGRSMIFAGVAAIGSTLVMPDQINYLIPAGCITSVVGAYIYGVSKSHLGVRDCLDDNDNNV